MTARRAAELAGLTVVAVALVLVAWIAATSPAYLSPVPGDQVPVPAAGPTVVPLPS